MDAGSWHCYLFAVARAPDRNGELFDHRTYIEGDTSMHCFRSQNACCDAITAELLSRRTMASPTARITSRRRRTAH
jgi:hypothetical protein